MTGELVLFVANYPTVSLILMILGVLSVLRDVLALASIR